MESPPKIFISYCWSDYKTDEWVLDIAERLVSDGIDVVLDKWDLKEGQDKNVFMERMVSNPDIIRVLIICDKSYQKKANLRKGGVGTESQIISQELYDNVTQEKFIPIIREYDDDGKPCIPFFMSSRIFIDLSLNADFENNYITLVRNLYNKPKYKKPALGNAPIYINDDHIENTPIAELEQLAKQIKSKLSINNSSQSIFD